MTVCFPELVSARLDVSPERLRELAARLSGAEHARAARFRRSRDRRRFVAARAKLRELLAARLDAAPEAIEFGYGAQGKPALGGRFARSGLYFNVSHSSDLALYAFARRALGVDVEALRPLPEADAIAARVFSANERQLEFFYCWTRKEAYVKALGGGLSLPLPELDLSCAPRGWRVESFSPAPGFVAATAFEE